jgi:hypothetical protein
MKISTISYEKCHNLGNYEHEKMRLDAILADGEDPSQALDVLRCIIDGDIERADLRRDQEREARYRAVEREDPDDEPEDDWPDGPPTPAGEECRDESHD